jgi:hypothetical protein
MTFYSELEKKIAKVPEKYGGKNPQNQKARMGKKLK